ncbi:hypothetical protein FKW77_001162 [Venturia effusa]|uniref:Uncharacterized protein n=1 Tax=Venturia effusa TaxID=50376 RepID=A0A517L8K7_9PEZI|nr:hypothetical protein FKW77_001162 [Venturia effusa]
MSARLRDRVRKHSEDIGRSLEKICDIIDEHRENNEDTWDDEIPDFLDLVPMRYRAGNYVLELTAMHSDDRDIVNRLSLAEIFQALSQAFERAESVPYAMTGAFSGKESITRQLGAIDDETLASILRNIAGSFKMPHLTKTAMNCLAVLLQQEVQALFDQKIAIANENIGIYELPEDGRLTRSRSRLPKTPRSNSPDTLTPNSSLEDRSGAKNESASDAEWAADCDGCFAGCELCQPTADEFQVKKETLCGDWEYCNDLNCDCLKSEEYNKAKKAFAGPDFSLRRHGSSKISSRTPEKHTRRRRWSIVSSESGPSIVRDAKAVFSNDDSDLDDTSRVPGPKIYTATAASSTSKLGSMSDLRILDLLTEDVWDHSRDYRRRRGRVTWSDGSSQYFWMDKLSKNHPQQLIDYYEKSLPSRLQQQISQLQPYQHGDSNYEPVHANNAIRFEDPSKFWSSAFKPSMTGYGSGLNNATTPNHSYTDASGLHNNSTGNAKRGGTRYGV